MTKDKQPSNDNLKIDTGGGASFGKDVKTGGGNFTGRDTVIASTIDQQGQNVDKQINIAIVSALDTKEKLSTIELVINQNFDDYSKADQAKLLEAITILLRLNKGDVKILKKVPGSVHLFISLPQSKVLELFRLVKDGALAKYYVSKLNFTDADSRQTDLSGIDLSGVDLSGVKLTGVNLTGADLSGADLTGANLFGVNLTGANLSGAILSWVILLDANLTGADLTGADLTGAELFRVNLSGTNLSGAELSGVRLSSTNLSDANLSDVNLSNANLSNANLTDLTVSN